MLAYSVSLILQVNQRASQDAGQTFEIKTDVIQPTVRALMVRQPGQFGRSIWVRRLQGGSTTNRLRFQGRLTSSCRGIICSEKAEESDLHLLLLQTCCENFRLIECRHLRRVVQMFIRLTVCRPSSFWLDLTRLKPTSCRMRLKLFSFPPCDFQL